VANQWLRLWHDMPTDPKWRTISRISGESISLVIAVYMHLLVDASRNVTRGHVTVTVEDLASALDVTEKQIESIFSAMDGRVMTGKALSGWDKRQVKREDSGDDETGAKSAAQRKAEQREREKQAMINASKSVAPKTCHDESRNVTLDKNRLDKELIPSLSDSANPTDPVIQNPNPEKPESKKSAIPPCPFDSLIDAYEAALPSLPSVTRSLFRDGVNGKATAQRWAWVMVATHEKGKKKGERLAVTQQDGIDWFTRFFDYAAGSDFLTGANGKFTGCSMGWLMAKSNFEKVLAGNYHMDKAA